MSQQLQTRPAQAYAALNAAATFRPDGDFEVLRVHSRAADLRSTLEAQGYNVRSYYKDENIRAPQYFVVSAPLGEKAAALTATLEEARRDGKAVYFHDDYSFRTETHVPSARQALAARL
ncbi:MAG TPA: hypothetical protein VFR09_04930, partial [Alphaproteobacteria bacterium]|nr:hypothetical protein [Alphaproteobacteria bacterium]